MSNFTVKGFVTDTDLKFRNMAKIHCLCKESKVKVPKEVTDYFKSIGANPLNISKGQTLVDLQTVECQDGSVELKIRDIPEEVRLIVIRLNSK